MEAKTLMQWVGAYTVAVDDMYQDQKNAFDSFVKKKRASARSVTEKLCQLENYLSRFLDMLETKETEEAEMHVLFIEIIVLMEDINRCTQYYEVTYKSKDGNISHPVSSVSIGNDNINRFEGLVLESGRLTDNIPISWKENDIDDFDIYNWPQLPESLYIKPDFPDHFYFVKGDTFQIKRGETLFVWRRNNHYHRTEIKAPLNIASFPCDKLREEYEKYVDEKENELYPLIDATLQLLT